jgi:hypothetical protein
MRMEELSDSRYIKNTDTVERYLLNLVQEYFKNSNIAPTTSKEYIIKRALERMREEISYDSIGVLSITLPDGEKRTGAITITLEDLNGEPLISPKYSAFNVNFGNEKNTACEGNDPRLSDARKPLAHEHDIKDIIGLEGILSTLTGRIERIGGFAHEHSNKNVLDILVYTGEKASIDLTSIEVLENKIINLIDTIRDEILEYKNDFNNQITDLNENIINAKTEIEEYKLHITETNQEYYNRSIEYTDAAILEAQKEIDNILSNLIDINKLQNLLNIANNTFTLVNTINLDLNKIFNFNNNENQYIYTDIDTYTLDLISQRNQLLKDCQFEFIMQYVDKNTNETVFGSFPYILFNDNLVDGSIQISISSNTNQLLFSLDSTTFNIPEEIKDARIICNIYSKQEVTLV